MREYEIVDLVWLEATNITTDRPSKKLDEKRWGPFKVISKIGASSYKLDITCEWKQIHIVFNEVLLSEYIEPKFPDQPQNTRPPPIAAEGAEDEYEVDEIINSRKSRGGKMFYKVKWKGYGPHEWSWEPKNHVKHTKDLMEKFHQ